MQPKKQTSLLVVAVGIIAITGILGYVWLRRRNGMERSSAFHAGERSRLCQTSIDCRGCPLANVISDHKKSAKKGTCHAKTN